jgi:outer membrane protein TolC
MTSVILRRNGWIAAAILASLLTCRPAAVGAQEAPPRAGLSFAVPQTYRLTLDEAKQLALQNNQNLVLARLNVAEKRYGISAARRDYLPKIFGNVTYLHFNDDLGTVLTAGRGPLGIVPPISKFVAVYSQDTTIASVVAAQPLTKLILVNAGVQIAKADTDAAQAQLDKGTREVLSGVAQAYHGLVGALRIQNALALQVKLLEEVLQAKPLPPLRVALVEAKQGLAQVRGQVQELTDLLNDLLGLPPCTVLEVVDPVPADLPLRCADEAAQMAVANSPQIREAATSVAKAEAALQAAKVDYIPDVNVLGGYVNQSLQSYVQPNIGFVGVTASYTFVDWGKRGQVRRQREALIAVARQNLRVTADKVQQEARKAYGTYVQAREAYKLAGEMVQARKEAEKAAEGMAALEAKGDTAKAELELMKAEITYRVAHAQLAAAINWEACAHPAEVQGEPLPHRPMRR